MGKFSEKIVDDVVRELLDPIARLNRLSHGEVFYVFEDSDTDLQKKQAEHKNVFVELEAAYAAVTSNRNDIIYLNGQSTHSIADGIAWTKGRVHVVGMDGGGRTVQQGSKIELSGNVATAYVLKNTGTRNSFRNIKFIQASTNAAALHCVEMGGEGNLYENCSFIFGTVDNLDQTNAYEVVCGEDSGTFLRCIFGSDVLDTSVARAVMVADVVTTSQEMKSCYFEDCMFTILSDDANANFFRVLATTDLKFGTVFKNCIFFAVQNATTGGVLLTDAVDSVSSLVEGSVFFVNCHCNCTNFSSAISDQFHISSTASDAATSGVGVTPA